MLLFKCKMCGGDIKINEGITTAECEYCGTKQIVPQDAVEFFDGDTEYQKAVANDKRKKVVKRVMVISLIIIGIITLLAILVFTHIICFHQYSDASVLEPQRCYYCDKTLGDSKPLTKMDFPQKGLADLLPIPKSNMGDIDSDTSTYVEIYVGEMSLDDFNDYIDGCSNNGFNIDYQRYDSSVFGYEYYHAKDVDGNSINLKYYEEKCIMEIRLYAP